MRICEIFRSLQGEGLMMGVPTTFVRTVGCNLDCTWCDTPYAREGGEEKELQEVIEKVRSFGMKTVCVTGGEPLLQKETYELIDSLLNMGYRIQLETNGSISIDDLPSYQELMISMDIKTPSSRMSDRMIMENLDSLTICDQLKFVINDEQDMDYVEDLLSKHDVKCPVILTSVGGVDLRKVAEWVICRKMEVRVLPQLHKIIWGEERGH